jgi:hypothetical protein
VQTVGLWCRLKYFGQQGHGYNRLERSCSLEASHWEAAQQATIETFCVVWAWSVPLTWILVDMLEVWALFKSFLFVSPERKCSSLCEEETIWDQRFHWVTNLLYFKHTSSQNNLYLETLLLCYAIKRNSTLAKNITPSTTTSTPTFFQIIENTNYLRT